MSGRKAKYVSPELAARVRAASEQLGYLPDLLARSMKGKSRRMVAILVPEFWNPVFTRMVIGAEQVARENGYLLMILSTLGDPDYERDHLTNLAAQRVDGCLRRRTGSQNP
jgi:DNA-binding LacI/PurR family transcriptional regulator